jgi:eukaryotic-like serine/threonine-protein kinase
MDDARNDTVVAGATGSMNGSFGELEFFGPYGLAGLIARGGMAELHLAIRDQGPFRQVLALKRVLPGVEDLDSFNRMFAQEAALSARLEHPNIVRVFDFGEVNGQAYLAMEYLPGEDLERILKRYRTAGTRMPLRMAAEIARSITTGLAHAHALTDEAGQPLNLVHRDVTPSNVVVTYQGTTKLVDFGIAKARSNSFKTSEGAIKGKLAYLPPEAFTRTGVDARGDVYSAGCVLWEMMVGSHPFQAPNDAALVASILHGELPDVRSVAPDVDDVLAAICMRALARDPEHRFPSAASMEEALDSYLGGGGRLGHKQIAQWMIGLFGPERAQAKLDVASGSRLSTAIPQILAERPRRTGLAPTAARRSRRDITPPAKSVRGASAPVLESIAATPEGSLAPGRWLPRWLVVALGSGTMAIIAAGLIGLLISSPAPALPAAPWSSLVVESSPEGAAVFVDGSPLGRVTPTTLARLHPGRAILLGVQLAGFEPGERRIVPAGGQSVERFSLSALRSTP